ncbi:MAG: hypothetical protein Tsb0032_44260 [Kiloniellaceae bacterium]
MPVPENHGERGRPPHIPTPESRNQVRLLVAWRWTDQRIAQSQRISVPTLKKHYFAELAERAAARAQLRAAYLSMVFKRADEGSDTMIKELGRLIAQDDLAAAGKAYGKKPKAAKAPKLGKKEQAQVEAQEPTGGWEGLLH